MEGRRQEKVDAGREKFAAYQKRKKKSVRQRDRVQGKEDEAGGETLLSDTSTGALDMSLCSSFSSVSGPCETGSDVARELNAKVRELEDVISGQQAALEALRGSSREQQAEHKAQLDSYVARLREYEGAVQERNAVIERLTASLHAELTTRCALQQQGDHLAQEVSLLERQLQATSELVEGHHWDTGVRPDQYLALQNKVLTLEASLQSVEELKARLAAAEAERDDTAHELRQHKSRSAQEVQRLMGEVEQVQQRAAAAAAEHARKLAETEEGLGLQLRLKEEHRRHVEEEKRLLQVAYEELSVVHQRSPLENGGLEVASRQLDDALRANADTRAAMAEARRRYEEELAAVRKQSDEEARALQRDVDELRQQLERAVSESRRLSGELEREREAHARDVAALSAQLREHGQACQLQEESHKQVVQALNERLKEAAQGEEKTPDVVTAHLESFRADRRRYEERVDALNARLQESMKTGEARERLLADKEAELVVLKAQVSKVSSLLELATQSENALAQQVGSLSARLQEADKNKVDAESYKLQNDELNCKIKKLNDDLSSREQKIKEYDDEVTELKSRLVELEGLKVQAENYEAKIKNLSSETKELLKYKDKALALQNEIDLLQGNLNELSRMFPDAEALVPSEHHVSKREAVESFFTVDKLEQLRVKLGVVLKQREEDRCLHQAEVARLNEQIAANAQVAERQAAEWEERIAFYRDRLESLSGQVCAVEEQQRTEVSRLQDAHRTEVERLKSSLDQEVAALKAELAAQKAHHAKELEQHQAAFNVELSRLKEAHDLKLVELDETYKSQSAVQVQELGSPEEKTGEQPGEVEAKGGELSGPHWSELELCRQQIAVLKGRLEEASAAQQEHIATVAACQLQVESYKQQVELLDGRCEDELAARQTELDELRGKIQSMTDGEKGLREHLLAAQAQIQELQNSRIITVTEVTNDIEQQKGQLGVKEEELARVHSQLQEKTDCEKGLREHLFAAQAQIQELQNSHKSTVAEVMNDLEQLKGQLSVRDEELMSLRSQLQEKTDCEKGLREQILTAEAQIRNLQESRESTMAEVTNQLELLKGQLGLRNEELASLHNQLQEKTDCEKALREQILTAEAQIRELRESRESTVAEVTNQVEQLKGQLAVRDEELTSLRSQLQEKTDCEKGLREQIMTAEAQILELRESRENTVAEVTKQLEQLKGQLGVRDGELTSLRIQLQEKTDCEKGLREQILTAEAQIRELRESRESTVAEVTNQVEQLKGQLAVKDEELVCLRIKLQEKTDCEKGLREQMMTAEAQILELRESRDSTVAEVTNQLEQLKGQLGLRNEALASLHDQLQEKTDCEKGLREQIMTAEAQIRDLQESRESTVAEVTNQVEQLKEQLAVREEELACLRSDDGAKEVNEGKTRGGRLTADPAGQQADEGEPRGDAADLQEAAVQCLKMGGLLAGKDELHLALTERVARLERDLETSRRDNSQLTLKVVKAKELLKRLKDEKNKASARSADLEAECERLRGEGVELGAQLESAKSERDREVKELLARLDESEETRVSLVAQLSVQTKEAGLLRERLRLAERRCEAALAARDEYEREVQETWQVRKDAEDELVEPKADPGVARPEMEATQTPGEERLPSWDEVLSDYQREVLGQLAVRCEQHAGLGDLLGSSGILQETMFQQKQQLLQRLQGAEHGQSVSAMSGCDDILAAVEHSLRRQHVAALQAVARAWRDRYESELAAVVLALEETARSSRKSDAATNCQIEVETLLAAQERLLSALEDVQERLRGFHHGAVARLREEMQAEHGRVLQQLQQMRAAVSSLRSPDDSSREGVLGTDAGQLRRELEQKHTREMEELRRYFEQKCADVEKRYAEEVFSQHGRKLSASSAGSGEELAVDLCLAGGDHQGRRVPALTHICDSYSVEPGYKDLEEHCRADYERRLLESRDHLKSKHSSELAALHDHYQQLLLQHQPLRMSAGPVEPEGASEQQPGNKPGAEEHFVESVIDKLACITVDAALSKVCTEPWPRGEERCAETADASSQVPHAAEGTPEARQRTDGGQEDSFASLLGSLRRASGSAVTGCLDRLEAAHEEELRAARSAVLEQAGMLEVEHVACQQRLHEQVEQARCDVVATLHHHLQALLSESGPIPQELAALQERFAGPLLREVDRLKQELAALNTLQQKDQLTFSCQQSSLVELDSGGSLEGLIRERDELQQALVVLRCVVRELLDYCARCEEELNGTLVEELSPTDRVHLSPDTTALASLVRDHSLPSDSSHVSMSLRGELDRCLARLHAEASSVLALSRGLTRGKELVGEGLCELATPRRPPPNDPAHSLLYARRSMSEPSSPPSKLLDEAQRERDRLLEEARRDKEDLRLQVRVDPSLGASCKLQVEAADKQLRATRLFLEEQAAEREQEREESVREAAVLRAQLRDRERDRAEHRRLLKEVDGLDLQLKESATQLAQSEADRARLQADLDSAAEKISTLREIIVELEVAVENRSANEKNLKQRLADLECLLHQQDESHRQQFSELESLREEAGPAHLAAHVSALEEQLRRHRLHVEQFESGSGAVRRMRSQIRELEAAVGRKTRELESVHCVVPCDASPAGSPLSEDVSIREQLDVMRCCSPDRGLTETPSPVPLPLEDFQRLQEKVERLCRAEEAALKRIADLEMELRGVRRREEEVSAERDVLLLQTEEQLLRTSALQARLDDQRRAVDSARRQAEGELRAELQDRTDEMHSLRDACDASRKEVEEVRGLLDQARRQAAVQEAEAVSLAERLASRDDAGDRHSSHAQDLDAGLGVMGALLADAREELRAAQGDVSRLGAERARLRALLDCHRSLDLSARQQARLSALRAAETEPGDPRDTHFSEEVFREAAETSLSYSLLPSQEQTAVSHPDVPDHTTDRDQPSKELDDARTALESVQRQNAELSRQVEDLLACRAALEDSKAENSSLAERAEALGAECSALRQDKLDLEQRVECLTAQCSRVDGLQRERLSLLEEVEALKKRCSTEETLRQEKVALAARCDELQRTCGALEAVQVENASLAAELALLKQECSTLKKIQDENHKLSQQLEIFQAECSTLRTVQQEKVSLAEKVNELESKCLQLEGVREENKSQAQKIVELQTLCSLANSLRDENAALSQTNAEQLRENSRLLQEIKNLGERSSVAESVRRENSSLIGRIRELEARCSAVGSLQEERDALSRRVRVLEDECGVAKDAQRGRVEALESVLLEKTALAAEMEARFADVLEENAALSRRVQELEAQCALLQGSRRDDDGQALSSAHLELEQIIVKLQEENRVLRNAYVKDLQESEEKQGSLDELSQQLQRELDESEKLDNSLLGTLSPSDTDPPAGGALEPAHDALLRKVLAAGFPVLTLSELSVVHQLVCEASTAAGHGMPCDTDTGSTAARMDSLRSALDGERARASQLAGHVRLQAQMLADLQVQQASVQGSIARYIELLETERGRSLCLEGKLASERASARQLTAALEAERQKMRSVRIQDCSLLESMRRQLDVALENEEKLQRQLQLACSEKKAASQGARERGQQSPVAEAVVSAGSDSDGDAELRERVLALKERLQEGIEGGPDPECVLQGARERGQQSPVAEAVVSAGSDSDGDAELRERVLALKERLQEGIEGGPDPECVLQGARERGQQSPVAEAVVSAGSDSDGDAELRERVLALKERLQEGIEGGPDPECVLQGARERGQQSPVAEAVVSAGSDSDGDAELRERVLALKERLQEGIEGGPDPECVLQGARERGQQSPVAEAVVSAGSDSDGDAELRERVLALKERLQEMSSAQHIDTLEERLAPLRQREQQLLEELGDARRQAQDLRTALVVREQRLAAARDQLTALSRELSASRSREAELERRLTPEGLEASEAVKGGAASAANGVDCRDVEWLQEQIKVLRENEKVNRAAWLQQKAALEDALEAREHQRVTGDRLLRSGCDIEERMTHLFGKYLRVESYRKSLVWQKRYLLVALSGYRDHEAATLGRLAVLAGRTPVRPHPSPRTRFRVAVVAVMAIQRMRYLVRRWRHGRRVGRSAIVGRPCCECVAPETHPSCRLPQSPPSRDEGTPWHSSGPHRPWRLGEDGRVTLLEPGTGAQFAARSDLIQRRLGLAAAST
ncbi:pericentrin-like isoform X2 [Bacillus rossius redtenbacheri]|uniref:pericentrin-like isoform X2 n=1 Tax=Bacillus rossius redtenbacheri TaxID=93214 RepID=UPI002FDC929B